MTTIIWNVTVEWDAVWQKKSAKTLLKTIELLRVSQSWPDLCQLVADDKQDLSLQENPQRTCQGGPIRADTHPSWASKRTWFWSLVDNEQVAMILTFIKFKSCKFHKPGPGVLTDDRPQLCTLRATVSYLSYYFTGAKKLVEKIKEYNPKIAVFNGKGIYEVFSGEKEFIFGKQPQKIADTDTVIIMTYSHQFLKLMNSREW